MQDSGREDVLETHLENDQADGCKLNLFVEIRLPVRGKETGRAMMRMVRQFLEIPSHVCFSGC